MSDRGGRRAIAIWAGAIALLLALGSPLSADDGSAPPLRDGITDPSVETVVVMASKTPLSDYRLGPGDKLRVTVYGEDDLSGAFQIDGKGYVRLPLIGQEEASGLTAPQLEAKVEHALDDGYLNDARVSIEVTEYRPFFIVGQVSKPGQYSYSSNLTVLDAVALAGGFTDKAVTSIVYIRHEGETEEHAISPDSPSAVFPGDVVRVEKTAFWRVADLLSPVIPLGYFASTI